MSISLRELSVKDAPLMLEWMHDPDIQKFFKKDMLAKTILDAEQFCSDAILSGTPCTGDSLHFAIVNEADEYLGTISLKNIDVEHKNAEYAISTRKKAHGKNIAYEATLLLMDKAFFHYGLHRIYLNVLSNNIAAIKLYKRCGFRFEGEFREHFAIDEKYADLCWYGIIKDEFAEQLKVQI